MCEKRRERMIKILLAEDDKDLNALVCARLVAEGYEAIPCASALGAAIFFLTVAAIVTVAVLVYSALPADMADGAKAGIMLGVIAALALLCTAADLARRKLTVDRPVQKILDATDAIAAGDFSVRLQPRHLYRRRDQYDAIMENLNKMAAELSRTEMLHNDFVSNVSHELKTPIAVIRNYAEALAKGAPDEETRRKYADALVAASKRLTALVTNVLKLNKLENQTLSPAFRRFRLDEMLAEAALAYEDVIERKHIDLICDLEETEITSAPDYLEIVWNNLLSNAVKFTGEGGTISLSLRTEGSKAIVRVADTGCGISAETGKHIFEKFYQGERSHAQEGNGLGLALVKKVIDLIGGEISVESEVGKGSAFTVTLHGV